MQSAHCLHGYRHGSQRTAGVEWLGSSAGRTKIIMANQQSLFKVIHGLRGFGVGQRVTRSIWHKPGTFWEVRRVQLKEGDPAHGKAWGLFWWNGKQKSTQEEEIRSPLKPQWRLVTDEEAAGGAAAATSKTA